MTTQDNKESMGENPLIWPLFALINASPVSCKVHTLASALQSQGLLIDLDEDANKALFKRNFLLMNALYQLQALLLPAQFLQVQALDIQLLPQNSTTLLTQDSALRSYYLDWRHFDTSSDKVEAMLNQFWGHYRHSLGAKESLSRAQALALFELDEGAGANDIRKRWRKLALQYHPDRISKDANTPDNDHGEQFRLMCVAWQCLRPKKSTTLDS